MLTFDRVLVGVDGTPASLAALDQARRLLPEGGELTAVVVLDDASAAQAGFTATRAADQLRAEADEARREAESALAGTDGASVRFVRGRARDALLELARETDASLVAVGSHEHRRLPGAAMGSVATRLAHDAPASVLIARPSADPERFPHRVVAGTDGSPAAGAAVEAARGVAQRTGAELRVVAGGRGKGVDEDALTAIEGLERDDRGAVDVLVAAGSDADLLVVGSRGLHGVRALGSVSERVAHGAACSVLIVRS